MPLHSWDLLLFKLKERKVYLTVDKKILRRWLGVLENLYSGNL